MSKPSPPEAVAVAAVPRVAVMPIEWLKPDPKELARHDDPEKTRLLGENMLARGQLADVLATEDGKLISGHGRLLAARSAGIKALSVKIYPAGTSDTVFRLIRAAENLQRHDLTGYRKFVLCTELLCGNPTWTQADLAKHLHLSQALITKLLSPSKLPKAWHEALEKDEITIDACYAASRADPAAMEGLLAMARSKAGREAIEAAARKSKNAAPSDAVRAAKVRCALPSGVTVTVAGEGVSLDEGIEALSDAIKEMKRARDLGYTAKTFAAAMADKARKKPEPA